MYLYTVHTGFVCLGWETLFILPSRNLSLYSFDMLHHRFVFLLVCICVSSLSLLDILLWPAFCLVFFLFDTKMNERHTCNHFIIFCLLLFHIPCRSFLFSFLLSASHCLCNTVKEKTSAAQLSDESDNDEKCGRPDLCEFLFSPFFLAEPTPFFFPRLIYTAPFSLHFLLLFWIDKILLQWKCDKFDGEKFNRS